MPHRQGSSLVARIGLSKLAQAHAGVPPMGAHPPSRVWHGVSEEQAGDRLRHKENARLNANWQAPAPSCGRARSSTAAPPACALAIAPCVDAKRTLRGGEGGGAIACISDRAPH